QNGSIIPVVGATVELMENLLWVDDKLLGSATTGPTGRYRVKGGASKVRSFEFYLVYKIDCSMGNSACSFIEK
ncbi:hypothetical protein PENTCL1PPCAC_5174, partial [Pristionchus entomophagus]